MRPTTTLTTVVATYMPTLKLTSDARPTVVSRNAYRRKPCCVPTPPGVNGSSVDRLCTASTIITLRAVVGTSKASRKNQTPAMRNTHDSACHETT